MNSLSADFLCQLNVYSRDDQTAMVKNSTSPVQILHKGGVKDACGNVKAGGRSGSPITFSMKPTVAVLFELKGKIGTGGSADIPDAV